MAQDERYFRQILKGEEVIAPVETDARLVRIFSIPGPVYKVDLNDDGIEESIQPFKIDGVDWIEIRNTSEKKLLTEKLFAMGAKSNLYKIKIVHLSPKLKALMLFLDEGSTEDKRFESTARLFIVSYENNDLTTMKISQGPRFFQEREANREQYFRRDYVVNVKDLDNDGTREITVQYLHIQRIMKYAGFGKWTEI